MRQVQLEVKCRLAATQGGVGRHGEFHIHRAHDRLLGAGWSRAAAAALKLALAAPAGVADEAMQRVGALEIDRTKVTVGAFARFAGAAGLVTKAEREGGGLVYAAGWQAMPGWTWRAPYGMRADPREPAVHLTYDEPQAYCRSAGKRLPTDAEWVEAAYTERREAPSVGFVRGRTYPYPTGSDRRGPLGANCLGDCGAAAAIDHSDRLARGHALAGASAAGVNGLYDMGANVWEWVDSGPGPRKRTRGGSWWYGAAQMLRSHVADKPRDMAAVYISFRCARDAR